MTTLFQSLGFAGGGVISLVGAGGKTNLMFSLAHEISKLGQPVLTTTTTKIMMPSKAQSRHVLLTNSVQALLEKSKVILKESLHISAASPRATLHRDKISGYSSAFIEEVHTSAVFQWIIVEADGAAQRPLKVPADHEPVIPGVSTWVIGVVGLSVIGKPLYPAWVFRHDRFAGITGLSEGMTVSINAVAKAMAHPLGIFKGSPPAAHKTLFLNTKGDAHLVKTGNLLAQEMLAMRPTHDIRQIAIGSPLEGMSDVIPVPD